MWNISVINSSQVVVLNFYVLALRFRATNSLKYKCVLNIHLL